MNVLTRTFVVVVTILSVVLVALVIPFAARVPNYAEKYQQMEQDRNTQLAKASETRTKILNEIAEEYKGADEAFESVSRLTSELDVANNEIKSLQTRLNQAQVTVARNSAAMEIAARMNETKGSQITQQSDLIQQQLAALGELQSQRADLSQALIESRSNVRRLTDGFMRVQEENKALSQQLLEAQAKLRTAMDKLAGFVDDAEGAVASTVTPPTTIRGSVTKIDQVTEGLTFVQVNVGTRDLVRQGMEFTVYRGDEFVGKIQIASVDTAESVGQLTLGGGIQEGDAVRAGGR